MQAFDIVTIALRLKNYGLRPGSKADFVALRAENVPEAVASVPRQYKVFKGGKPIAENGVLLESLTLNNTRVPEQSSRQCEMRTAKST